MKRPIMFFDKEAGGFITEINYELYSEYSAELENLFNSLPDLPSESTISFLDQENIRIFIPSDGKNSNELIVLLTNLLSRFQIKIIELECSQNEIIPLEGYPRDKIKEEIQIANQKKRNLRLVDNYRSFQEFEEGRRGTLIQYTVKYGTNEYCDLFLDLLSDKFDEISKTYKPKLTEREISPTAG